MPYVNCHKQGVGVEDRFIDLIGDSFIRMATPTEDRREHWDVLCAIGKIDIKGQKRASMGDVNTNPDLHYYEFMNVAGEVGWGIPTDVDRVIAFESTEGFILVRPEDVYYPLLDKCAKSGGGSGFFQCRGRQGRRDWFTKVPTDFLRNHSFKTIRNDNGL